jgi:hypothetical protein
MYIHTYIHTYCVCVCVCVCRRRQMRGKQAIVVKALKLKSAS